MSDAGAAAPDPVHRVVEANGIRMRLVEQGAGPLVLLCHGFPESWFHTSSGDARRVHRPLPPTARLTDALLDCERPPAWLPERDLDLYAAEFARTGFTGALNWYRAMDLSWELTAPFAGARVAVPALFLGGDRDLALLRRQDALDLMAEGVPTLWGCHLLPGCGHWTQQERPAEVNRAILGFLAGLGAR